MNNEYRSFLRNLRKKHNQVQQEMSDRLGCTKGTISLIERGRLSISYNMYETIINKYNLSVKERELLDSILNSTITKRGYKMRKPIANKELV